MIKVVPNWVILIAVLGVFAVVFGSTFYLGHRSGAKSVELEDVQKENTELINAAKRERELRVALEAERTRLREVSAKLQDSLGKSGVVHEQSTRIITKEVEKPVYRDLGVPASGVQILSESAKQFNSVRQPKN